MTVARKIICSCLPPRVPLVGPFASCSSRSLILCPVLCLTTPRSPSVTSPRSLSLSVASSPSGLLRPFSCFGLRVGGTAEFRAYVYCYASRVFDDFSLLCVSYCFMATPLRWPSLPRPGGASRHVCDLSVFLSLSVSRFIVHRARLLYHFRLPFTCTMIRSCLVRWLQGWYIYKTRGLRNEGPLKHSRIPIYSSKRPVCPQPTSEPPRDAL
jgi:hypothetical protein